MTDGKLITAEECAKNMEPIQDNLNTVLKALVGDDLRGGLVKDVADTKKDISETKKDISEIMAALKNKQGCGEPVKAHWGRREYVLVAVAAIGALASVLVAAIEAFAH